MPLDAPGCSQHAEGPEGGLAGEWFWPGHTIPLAAGAGSKRGLLGATRLGRSMIGCVAKSVHLAPWSTILHREANFAFQPLLRRRCSRTPCCVKVSCAQPSQRFLIPGHRPLPSLLHPTRSLLSLYPVSYTRCLYPFTIPATLNLPNQQPQQPKQHQHAFLPDPRLRRCFHRRCSRP